MTAMRRSKICVPVVEPKPPVVLLLLLFPAPKRPPEVLLFWPKPPKPPPKDMMVADDEVVKEWMSVCAPAIFQGEHAYERACGEEKLIELG
jgi:hypothetical protein